jgi:membrane associated rhomboid family serine protease
MIPLRDNNPPASFPIVTILLIAINLYLFFDMRSPDVKAYYEMIPADVVSGQVHVGVLEETRAGGLTFHPTSERALERIELNSARYIPVLPTLQPTWLTIFTSMFLHENLLHVGGNMLFLWIFGNNVEDALGKVRYLLFYLTCGFIAALAQILVSPDSLIPNLGASGAIAGVMGAYLVMWPEARVTTLITALFIWFIRDISAFWVLGLWTAMEVLEGIYGLNGQSTGNVAVFAHIGGFFAGVLIVLMMGGRGLAAEKIAAYRRPRRR